MKKLFSFNLDQELREKLERYAKEKNWSLTLVVEKALIAYCGDTPEKVEVKATPIIPFTEEERLADWEWRKKMVAEGKFSPEMAMEYPVGYDAPANTDTSEFSLDN